MRPTRDVVRYLLAAMLLLLGSATAVIVGSVGQQAAAAPLPTSLARGASLSPGQSIYSPGGKFELLMQVDGNLVLYESRQQPLWSSRTWGNNGAHAILQVDGNLVVYGPSGTALWWSGTWAKPATALQVGDDGNVVLYAAGSMPLWSTGTYLPPGNINFPGSAGLPALADSWQLRTGDRLNPGQALTSPDGRFTAVMQSDGNFVVFSYSQPTWWTNTYGRPGSYMVLQGDGNLVIYSPSGIALWAAMTAATRVMMQSDGNLVAYSPDRALWATSFAAIPPQRLARGETMSVGQSITAPNGAYHLTQQSDGNLVMYSAGNVATWSSGTWRSPGATAGLTTNGNLAVTDTDGNVAYQTFTSNAVSLIPQDDGNLVLYLSSGAPVWASQGQVRPMPGFLSGLAQRSAPAQSTSRYIRNLVSGPSDLTYWRTRGAQDAGANQPGYGYVQLLDIGVQSGSGVLLSANARYVSYGNLVATLNAYVDGYFSAMHPGAPVVIALGTNNDSTSLAASWGVTWAQVVVNPVARHAAAFGPSQVTIAGANDIEPGFRGSVSSTMNWMSGYLSATGQAMVFNGSADGCSASTTNRTCNNGWTSYALYMLSTGMNPGQMLALPQIYNATMAAQWKQISLTGVVNGQPKVNMGGALTERAACDLAGPCASPSTSATAWNWLWAQLQSDSRSAVDSMPWGTDLTIN